MTEPDLAVTFEQAIANAARLLRHAETETNLLLMERLDELAGTWLGVASLVNTRENP